MMMMLLIFLFGINAFGQTCSNGQINGIFHTSCYPWQTGDGTLSIPNGAGGTVTKNNDTPRLQRAIAAALGRLVLNEADYFINDSLTVYSYRTIVGTGRSPYLGTINPYYSNHPSSKIVQTANNKSIFKIGEGVSDVAIRDLSLVSGYNTSGTMGILAEGGGGTNQSSLLFQFSNLRISGFEKGIYVNATNNGEWQFDSVRLDHVYFEQCIRGVHINSYNSGWSVTNINLLVPANGYGFYLQRSTYTSLSMLIGNGPSSGTPAKALVYVQEHANLSIQNTVAEGFEQDVHIDGNGVTGTGRNYPIYLTNNMFMNGITIKDSTVVSTGNQFGFGFYDVLAIAKGASQIYSLGDKFCFESVACETNKTYTLQDDAQLIFGSNKYKTEIDTLKVGTRTYSYLGTPGNGTLYYCSDCQQSSNCSTGGSGAMAKRINNAWVCN
jgi:hypothetical protein